MGDGMMRTGREIDVIACPSTACRSALERYEEVVVDYERHLDADGGEIYTEPICVWKKKTMI